MADDAQITDSCLFVTDEFGVLLIEDIIYAAGKSHGVRCLIGGI